VTTYHLVSFPPYLCGHSATTGLFFLLNFVVTLLPLGYFSSLTLWSLCYHWVILPPLLCGHSATTGLFTKLNITQWYQSDHKVKEEK
jgi:hypothetical protein